MEHSAEVHEQLLRRATNCPSLLDASLKEEMLGMLNQLLRKGSCRKNLYLFTEIFLCGLVVADNRNDSEVTKFVSRCLKEKFRRESLQKIETLE